MKKHYCTPQYVISFYCKEDVLTASIDPTVEDMDWETIFEENV